MGHYADGLLHPVARSVIFRAGFSVNLPKARDSVVDARLQVECQQGIILLQEVRGVGYGEEGESVEKFAEAFLVFGGRWAEFGVDVFHD